MVTEFAAELWKITLDLAAPLLLGLLIAGLLHVWLPRAWIERQLSRRTFGSVVRAVLVGVPMPLCSCGVVPTAIALRRQGASNGATTAFLISTPQTGVDSILVSASFLGWPFAIFKVIAAAVTGLMGGALANATDTQVAVDGGALAIGDAPRSRSLVEAVRYAIFELLAMIDRWLIVGVVVAAVLSVALPADFFADQEWTRGLLGMLLVLAVALPLYVCTTSSVPIAASLIAAGMPLGSALVFLMAGPATNLATMGAVYRGLGGKILAIYLGTVSVMSMVLGIGFEFVLADVAPPAHVHVHGGHWWSTVSAVLLIGLVAALSVRRIVLRIRGGAPLQGEDMDVKLEVKGMTCQHCVANVKKALEAVDGVEEAIPDLAGSRVLVRGGGLNVEALVRVVEKAGYSATAL
ncbi:MAG: hypothetical protein A2289_14930 [Deltaproteobacteria bacterium RIFOXYA12_FULL_58_15]|nr:MAG: hypothetical protein A2289_14930 [Deltaproteobacteria bacterium RIFOXYA12_FULL_58_15]OGR09773.1 MAG: hypothetical protein A2341_13120 [Deltaproteobacteria bacterium RIFOXYB12_FULL_58_9]